MWLFCSDMPHKYLEERVVEVEGWRWRGRGGGGEGGGRGGVEREGGRWTRVVHVVLRENAK